MKGGKNMGEELKGLKAFRKVKGLTVQELAKLSGVGKTTIYDLESSKDKNVTVNVLARLATVLEIKVYQLF